MSGTLVLRNRQQVLRVDLRLLRRMVKAMLRDLVGEQRFDLGVYLVATAEIVRLNETFLRHRGVTDVITFDYAESAGAVPCPALLHGEVFICVDEAARQARRFGTTWQSELVRYAVHALLHLRGFDDSRVRERRKMKTEENRILRRLTGRFELRKLALRKRTPVAKIRVAD